MSAALAMAAVEKAAYQALAEAVTQAEVYSDVPENAPLPIVIVGDLDADRSGGKDDDDQIVSLEVMTLIGLGERLPGFIIQDEIEVALDGHTVVTDGWQLTFRHDGAEMALAEDGAGYVGASRFTIDASPAA